MPRRLLAVATTAALLLFGAARPAAAASTLVALWDMNEGFGARTLSDSSGRDLRGTVGREIMTGVRSGGATGYRFPRLEPDTPPPHPQHLAVVPDYASLDPGDRDYAVTVRLRTTNHFGNIVQKGQATVSGGNFKLQIPNGVVQCLFRGSAGQVLVASNRRLNDGDWHTVRCVRTEYGLSLFIDRDQPVRRAGVTGRIANAWPLSIGGKTDCDQEDVGCDYYAGDLDYVEINAR